MAAVTSKVAFLMARSLLGSKKSTSMTALLMIASDLNSFAEKVGRRVSMAAYHLEYFGVCLDLVHRVLHCCWLIDAC